MRYNQKKGYALQRDQQTFDNYLKSETIKWVNHIRSKWAEDLKMENWTYRRLLSYFGGYYKRSVIAKRWYRMRVAANAHKRD